LIELVGKMTSKCHPRTGVSQETKNGAAADWGGSAHCEVTKMVGLEERWSLHHSTHFNLQIHRRRRANGGKTRSRQEVETMSNGLEMGLATRDGNDANQNRQQTPTPTGAISNSNRSDTEMRVHELWKQVNARPGMVPWLGKRRDEWEVFNEARSEEGLESGAINDKPRIQS
jgi:hypothetical protein